VTNENNDNKIESIYSNRIRAGKRRTYFFDVRTTRGNDYYLTITESRKRFNDNGYDRHKIFLYKEDFNKFIKALGETVDYVKTELMPDFDFDAFNHDHPVGENGEADVQANNIEASSNAEELSATASSTSIEPPNEAPLSENGKTEEVDKW
jgi:hypothetical protein